MTVRLTVIALLGLLPFHLVSFTGHFLRLCQSASALTCALSLTKRRDKGDASCGPISAEVNLLKHPRKPSWVRISRDESEKPGHRQGEVFIVLSPRMKVHLFKLDHCFDWRLIGSQGVRQLKRGWGGGGRGAELGIPADPWRAARKRRVSLSPRGSSHWSLFTPIMLDLHTLDVYLCSLVISTRDVVLKTDAPIPIPALSTSRYHDTNTSCKMCVDDNFVKFVFVVQWNLWQSPCWRKNLLRNLSQIPEHQVILSCVMSH